MRSLFSNGTPGKIHGIFAEPENDIMAILLPPEQNDEDHLNVVKRMRKIIINNGIGIVQINYSVGKNIAINHQLVEISSYLDKISNKYRHISKLIVVGYGYGAFLGMQVLMRRPEISNFIIVNANVKSDFSFLAPCPVSGIIIQAIQDERCDEYQSQLLADSLTRKQRFDIGLVKINSNYMFTGQLDNLQTAMESYLHTEIIQ